jgi:hypothetical protein
VNKDSFGSKFAKNSLTIQNLKQKILNASKIKENEKIIEVNKLKCEYAKLMKEFQAYTNCTYTGKKHKRRCEKCIIEEKAKAINCQVYEKPLPEKETERDIVVFELCIPKSISLFRDSLFIIKNFMLQYENIKTLVYGHWIDYPFLKPYFEQISDSRPNYVALGSVKESFAFYSHNRKKHVSKPIEEFILENKYSLHLSTIYLEYGHTNHIIMFTGYPCFKQMCTFTTSFPYDALQWTLESNLHTENEVLAKQSLCPRELSRKEFIKYGSFRAGASLQLKNLLASLEARELSFENINVFKLIAQSLWEMGDWEIGDEYTFSRSHGDLENLIFVDHICRVLYDLLEIYKEKWNDHVVILNVIIITARLIDFVPRLNIKERISKDIMLKCREIINRWEVDIKEARKKLPSEDHKFIEKEFETSCFSILTYFVSKKYGELKFLLKSNENVVSWLCSIRNINNKKHLIKNNTFLRNLYRLTEICMIEIEDEYDRVIENDCGQALTNFLKIIWPEYDKGKFEKS